MIKLTIECTYCGSKRDYMLSASGTIETDINEPCKFEINKHHEGSKTMGDITCNQCKESVVF